MAARSRTGPEWVIGRIIAPALRGEVIADVYLLVDAGERRLIGMRATGPHERPAALTRALAVRGGTLAEAMRTAPTPVRIRSGDLVLAMEVAAVVDPRIPIELAPTPEIDALTPEILDILELAGRLSGKELGAIGDATRELYAAAARLHGVAPWEVLDEVVPLRVAIPALEIEAGCLVVLAGDPDARHIAFFDSEEDCLAFLMRLLVGQRADDPEGLGGAFVSLRFRELPDVSRAAFENFPLPGDGTYPVVTAFGRDGAARLASMSEVRVMTACCDALANFVITHRIELMARTSAALEVHVRDARGPEVRLWLEPSDDGTELN